ncbi:hypothetical protein PMKS-002479 [Pichia membranifaciens]|uniref:Uncharacterized protein n=1 Tax=Pichia membranifaciens TaxID=4926 RepID=A0A1Q2YHF0_9ASCO|nr:hypothetical protein PMKS-002479 [Pichia membranifaciens]
MLLASGSREARQLEVSPGVWARCLGVHQRVNDGKDASETPQEEPDDDIRRRHQQRGRRPLNRSLAGAHHLQQLGYPPRGRGVRSGGPDRAADALGHPPGWAVRPDPEGQRPCLL